MDKNKICEAIYASPEKNVVKRRKPMTMPALLLAAGATLIVLNNLYGPELTNNLRSAVVFVGGGLAVGGLVMLAARVFGADGAPFHKGEKKYLLYEELYFDRTAAREVIDCVNNGLWRRLLEMPRSRVPAVTVALYHTPGKTFAAMQAFEYTELEYRAVSELKIVNG